MENTFKGSKNYVASPELMNAVNIAMALKKPLLIKGEPGTGKTMLAEAVAEALGKKLIIWNIKSTTKAQDGLYVYDVVQRLYDSQFGNEGVDDIGKYVKLGKLGEAFHSEEQVILLIDEIDKADLEFPNDLLWELDKMEFYIPETKETVKAKQRPIVIITSNAEKELPDAFLRRCIFHYIEFPDAEQMEEIIKEYGLGSLALETLKRTIGCERVEVKGNNYTAINNDCVEEVRNWPTDSIDLYVTSIPFGNHYEYSPSYNDFGHNPDDAEFFRQMDYLTPELLRTLKPGRVAAIHVKDRVEFANVTGLAAPTIEPFHADCIAHFRKHGFAYFGMITVVTDVVRENNQTYRLGWTEQCKDGTKMGVGCPEYILLFRKLPTDCSRGYADTPVKKSKEEYTRAQWQIDAHAFWRSSGDRPFTREELEKIPTSKLQNVYRKFSRNSVYSYEEHVKLAESLDKDGRLPSTFMVVAPGSWDMTVWDDINRMRTLNTTQSQRRQNLHVCPLQIDIVQRLIERYSNEGELVADPFAGLFTVPYEAVKMNRKGKGVELNPDYFRDGVGYLESADAEKDAPTLFDLLENGA